MSSASRILSVFLARGGGGCGDARTRRGEARRCETRRGKARRGEARQEPILPLESERVSERTTTPRRRGRGGPSPRSFSLASRARCESPRQAPLLRRASRPEGAHGVRRGRGRGRGDERVGGGERTSGGEGKGREGALALTCLSCEIGARATYPRITDDGVRAKTSTGPGSWSSRRRRRCLPLLLPLPLGSALARRR